MHEVVSASSYLTPSWAVAPFVGYLFLIAALPTPMRSHPARATVK